MDQGGWSTDASSKGSPLRHLWASLGKSDSGDDGVSSLGLSDDFQKDRSTAPSAPPTAGNTCANKRRRQLGETEEYSSDQLSWENSAKLQKPTELLRHDGTYNNAEEIDLCTPEPEIPRNRSSLELDECVASSRRQGPTPDPSDLLRNGSSLFSTPVPRSQATAREEQSQISPTHARTSSLTPTGTVAISKGSQTPKKLKRLGRSWIERFRTIPEPQPRTVPRSSRRYPRPPKRLRGKKPLCSPVSQRGSSRNIGKDGRRRDPYDDFGVDSLSDEMEEVPEVDGIVLGEA